MKAGRELERERSFTAAGWAKNYNQQRIARQSAHAPANVVPVASNGQSEDEKHDDDQANVLEPLWCPTWLGKFAAPAA